MNSGSLRIYINEQEFNKSQDNSINQRPILLSQYKLNILQNEDAFEFSLSPSERNLVTKEHEFRCDTVREYQAWINAIKDLVHKS